VLTGVNIGNRVSKIKGGTEKNPDNVLFLTFGRFTGTKRQPVIMRRIGTMMPRYAVWCRALAKSAGNSGFRSGMKSRRREAYAEYVEEPKTSQRRLRPDVEAE
jgi:hypothetical protein